MNTVIPKPGPRKPINVEPDFVPYNMESPDGEIVVTVRDETKQAQLLAKKWIRTDRAKTPYKAPERLTDRPFANNPAFAQLAKVSKSSNYGKNADNKEKK